MSWTPPLAASSRPTQKYAFAAVILFLVGCILFFHQSRPEIPNYLHQFQNPPDESIEQQQLPAPVADAGAADAIPSQLAAGEWGHDHGETGNGEEGEETTFIQPVDLEKPPNNSADQSQAIQNKNYTTTIVMGRLKKNEKGVKWVYDLLENITDRAIYIVDETNTTELHLDRNHGREAIVYLKYIIEHYDKLNDISFFFHPSRFTWHNNLLLSEDSVETINRMNLEYVIKQGYVNTRCDHWPGCPSWITYAPSKAEHELDPHKLQDIFKPSLFRQLFPDEQEVPRYFAQTCCSQFAVSRDTIRSRPLEEYQRLYEWINRELFDQYTGRAMEMLWQYIFLRRGRYCPSMEECYCNQYSLCINEERQVNLLETWNQYRTRGEELQWQLDLIKKRFRREKGSEKGLQKDAGWRQVKTDEEDVKRRSRDYKALVMKEWGVEKSVQDW